MENALYWYIICVDIVHITNNNERFVTRDVVVNTNQWCGKYKIGTVMVSSDVMR